MRTIYTRDYPESVAQIGVPEHYGGTAFSESETAPDESETVHKEIDDRAEPTGAFGLFGKFLPKGLPILRNFKLGTEEILIIAVAAFLFFSRDGDKECALLLLSLLFIS